MSSIRHNPTSTTTDAALSLVAAERAKRAAAKAAKAAPALEAANPKAVLVALAQRKNGLLSARGLPCLCGCGAKTHTQDARFLSGHDAILRRNTLLRGQPLPEVVRPFFEAGEILAGMRLVELEDGTLQIEDVKKGNAGTMAVYAGI